MIHRQFLLWSSIAGTALLLTILKIIPFTVIETLGFITGAATVWLTVRQNIWCWPIGIANNIFFIFLFFSSRLYADMGLQVIYIGLSALGWYWWVRGGKNKTQLTVSRISLRHGLLLLFATIIGTYVMKEYLESINDAAPFLDALTTVLSLVAQYLLTRKFLENWYVWMTADILYIYLYITRELYLTGILYILFFIMCIIGMTAWRQSMQKS